MTTDLEQLGAQALAIWRKALEGASAKTLLGRKPIADCTPRTLADYQRIRLLAIGKAALPMAGAAQAQLGGHTLVEAIAVVPHGYPALPLPAYEIAPTALVETLTAGHPVPDAASAQAAVRALAMAGATGPDDLLIVLVSGGASALLASCVEAITSDEARATFKLLLGSGAAIDEMNCVRKHLSRISGGRLAAAASGDVLALAISDVPGDDLATIASGPTVPDPTTFADAQRILQKFNVWNQLPASVRAHVERGLTDAALETPKPGNPCLARTQTHLLGGIADALAAGAAAAAELGLRVEPARQPLQGDARGIGKLLARLAREHSDPLQRPMFPDGMLFGGETTVMLTGSGHGGRNQEVALRAAFDLEKLSVPVVVLSAGSDGVDGVAPAGAPAVAGALATPLTMPHARALGVDGQALLLDNDSYEFFARINPQLDAQQPNALPAWGGHVQSGPTHCNVMDIFLVLGAPMAQKQAPPKD